jgi:hypothetical protein
MIISDWLASPMFGGEFIFLALVVSVLLNLVLNNTDQNSITIWIPLGLGILGLYLIASGYALITIWPSSSMASSRHPFAIILSFWPYIQIIYGVVLVYLGFLAFSWLMLVVTFLLLPSGSIIQFFQSDETRLAIQLRAEQRESFLACQEDSDYKAILARLDQDVRVKRKLEFDRHRLEKKEFKTRMAEKYKGLIDSGEESREYWDDYWSESGAINDRFREQNEGRAGQWIGLVIERERYCLDMTGYSKQWKKNK